MTSLPFQFPVLAFGPDVGRYGVPGRERLDYFVSPESFSTCVSWKLKYRNGMTLQDSNNRCWKIGGVQNLGATGPLWKRILRFLVQQSIYRVSCQLFEVDALPLDCLKDRVCLAIASDENSWREDDVPQKGWDDPQQWQLRQLETLKGKVTASRSVAEIIGMLWPSESENSRMSVREAARSLEDRGLLVRTKGDQSELVIDRVRELLGRQLPQDLMDLYRERIASVGEFDAIAPSWNDWVGWSSDAIPVTTLQHVRAVPIFFDGCGNLFGLDLSSDAETPAVYFFDHEREFDRPIYAAGSSLGAFLLLLGEEDLAFQEKRPPGWQLAIDPDLEKCLRAPPIWRAG